MRTKRSRLHQHLRAETRLGRPSIEVVCVERRDGGLYVGDEDDRPLDLEQQEPDRAMVLRLVRRSITVTNRAVVPTLQSEKAPEAWSRSSVLRYRRLVPFEDGRAEVGGMTLTLDPKLGLMVTGIDPRREGGEASVRNHTARCGAPAPNGSPRRLMQSAEARMPR